jgi:predicted anti-sigma-YlaC factor YlaD
VNCDLCRDIVSAELDGEASTEEAAAAALHLRACGACRAHRDRVAALHRMVRVLPAEDVPDLTAAIVAQSPPPTSPVWRVGLALVAVAQVLTAVAHLDDGHLARDQASWDVALAAGFLWAAWWPARTAGLVPLTGVLTTLLLANGGLAVGGGGAHHLLAPIGLALLVLARREQGLALA